MTDQLPPKDDDAYKKYRKMTRPYRRAFRGIITRREAERFIESRVRAERLRAKEES